MKWPGSSDGHFYLTEWKMYCRVGGFVVFIVFIKTSLQYVRWMSFNSNHSMNETDSILSAMTHTSFRSFLSWCLAHEFKEICVLTLSWHRHLFLTLNKKLVQAGMDNNAKVNDCRECFFFIFFSLLKNIYKII